MNPITALLSDVARNLRASPLANPVEPAAARPEPFPCLFPSLAPTAHVLQDFSMNRFFVPSPLAVETTLPQAEIDRLSLIYSDKDVQRAAGDLRYKLDHLADLAMFRSLIAEAVGIADRTGVAPIEALRRLSEEADDALEEARADHRAHDAVVKARDDRFRPLVLAAGEISIKANAEREGIIRRLAAAQSQHAHTGGGAGRFHHLQAAGLTRDQMAALGQLDPEVAIAGVSALRARLLEVDGVLAQCKAFSADPLRRGHHLAGLGLDDLIEARRADERAPA